MKKVILTCAVLALSSAMYSCTSENEEKIYEESIEHEEIKETDI